MKNNEKNISIIPDLFLGNLIKNNNFNGFSYSANSISFEENIRLYYEKDNPHTLIKLGTFKDLMKIETNLDDIAQMKNKVIDDYKNDKANNSNSDEANSPENFLLYTFSNMLDNFAQSVKKATLKKLAWQEADWKEADNELKYMFDYHLCKIDGIVKYKSYKCKFTILIPLKLFRNILYLFTEEDFFKFKHQDFMLILQGGFEQIWLQKRAFFPFKLSNFLDNLSKLELQKLINLLIKNQMATEDMLGALVKIMDNGYERMLASLSKNQQIDFKNNWNEKAKEFDNRWVDIATYQTTLNIKDLIENDEYESILLEEFKEIFQHCGILFIKQIFEKKSLHNWLESLIHSKKLYEMLSKMDNLKLAKIFLSEPDKTFQLIRQNLSKRKLTMIKEDMDYLKDKTSEYESFMEKLSFVYMLSDFNYNEMDDKYKDLRHWFPRFTSLRELDFAINSIGPTDFYIALNDLDTRWKKLVLKNLQPPLQYFIEDLLRGRIRLVSSFGEQSIKESVNNTLQHFYRLEETGQIHLKDFSFNDLDETKPDEKTSN